MAACLSRCTDARPLALLQAYDDHAREVAGVGEMLNAGRLQRMLPRNLSMGARRLPEGAFSIRVLGPCLRMLALEIAVVNKWLEEIPISAKTWWG